MCPPLIGGGRGKIPLLLKENLEGCGLGLLRRCHIGETIVCLDGYVFWAQEPVAVGVLAQVGFSFSSLPPTEIIL